MWSVILRLLEFTWLVGPRTGCFRPSLLKDHFPVVDPLSW